MEKIKKIYITSIFFTMLIVNCVFADSAVLYTVPKNEDATTGPANYFRYNAEPKNAIPNTIMDLGPLGVVFMHQGKKYVKGKYLGNFKLTGYCSCTKCSTGTGITYSGKPATVNHTVAADLNVIPLNTFIILEGSGGVTPNYYDGVYQVEDKGGAVKDKHIDIYQATHQLAGSVNHYVAKNNADVYEAIPLEE